MPTNAQEIVIKKIALKSLDWLSPLSTLESFNSTEFGRDIAGKITHLTKLHSACQISLNRRPAAVVIPLDEYDKLLSMKSMLAELIAKSEENVVKQAADEFDDLIALISNPKTRAAADKLFTGNGFDLAATYQAGRTEKQ